MERDPPKGLPSPRDILVRGNLYHNNILTNVFLTSSTLQYSNQKIQCTYQLNFDFSYDIVKECSGWTLIFYCKDTVKFFSALDLDVWEEVLIAVMKRRRFHDFYKGVKKIGKGNFASVYLTQSALNGNMYAVKAFQKESTFKATNGKQGLQNEINILRKLNHPNITRLEGVFESENSIYLVMELIEGKCLGDILDQQKNLSLGSRKRIIRGVLSALSQMEARNIVHRDIKPENIMVDTNGEAKLVDFGLATDTQAPNYLYVRCGTPGYVAPEIISIKDTEKARMATISDVFSAGAIFYQMIFGYPLFDGEKNTDVLEKNRKCHISIPSNHESATYDELALLKRMLDIFPESRITAHDALRSAYFDGEREPLTEARLNLGPLKSSANNGVLPKKTKRIDNPEN